MIKYNTKSWFKLIFALHKSDTIRILWKELIYIGVFTLGIAYIEIELLETSKMLGNLISVYSLIGFVISLLLVFRTNTAYDRWWEGRKRWGCLVNDTRNFAIKIDTLSKNESDRAFFRRMIPNFVIATKEHLRDGVRIEELDLKEEGAHIASKDHIPAAIVNEMYKRLQNLKQSGEINEAEYLTLDHNLNAFLDSLGACERIKNTPFPGNLTYVTRVIAWIMAATIAIAIIEPENRFDAIDMVVVPFLMLSFVIIERLGAELKNPFENAPNDTPMTALCRTIERDLRQSLGEESLPPEITPSNGILM